MKKILYLAIALTGLLVYSCNDADDNLINNAHVQNSIDRQDQLYSLIERTVNTATDSISIDCVNFSYPVTLQVYNTALQPLSVQTVADDASFTSLIQNLDAGQSLSISYPIAVLSGNGDSTTINNNDELMASLLSCQQEEYIAWAGSLFCPSTRNCVWQVASTNWQGLNAKYVGGYFSPNPDGTITFHYNGESYTGTWVYLFTGTQLQLNINLEGTSEVAQYWNHSYPVTLNPDNISLEDESGMRFLTLQCEVSQTYNIGQQGPAGGTVFYDKGTYSEGWRYMEVATTDIDTLAQWGCDAVSIPGTQNAAIGRGLTNSGLIKAFFNTLPDYYTNPASCSTTADGTVAAAASLWVNNSYQQWFLPSKDELLLVYQNLTANNQGNMAAAPYWTATEADAATATVIDFATGQPADIPKAQANVKIRAVRYF
ncbi:hypothetical protein [Flavobacterium psychrotrophum]|uniref:hypothetical protein n=1 Tax=Flavobacterium psychrotrophum TaxID=2294119 RepID=UPI000E30DB62|nr:hypothetical protein [Flavobacterium psychrotrophum]